MTDNKQLSLLASLVLPPSILDYFDVTGMDVEEVTPKPGDFYSQVVHIYLDEKDNRTEELKDLRPNGFTEATAIEDFPIRDRKLILHVRRRRWINKENHNIIINPYQLVCDGTRYSPEFAAFLKGAYGDFSGDLLLGSSPLDDRLGQLPSQLQGSPERIR